MARLPFRMVIREKPNLSKYINGLRINYAANLLLNSNQSIAEVSYLCGFQNLGYFYRVFKQEYGIPPPNSPHASKKQPLHSSVPKIKNTKKQ